MVANFVTASVGLLDSVALVGPRRQPVLSVDVLARSPEAGGGELVPLEAADALIKGVVGANSPPLVGEAATSALPPDAALSGLGLLQPAASAAREAPGREATAKPAPVHSLAMETSPVARTLWHSSPPARPPRRCSPLAQARYVSIIDRAIARKKELVDGATTESSRRRGELSADDLLAVAVEEGRVMEEQDITALAEACDIPCADLRLVPGSSMVLAATP
jgi:hypothetical protein